MAETIIGIDLGTTNSCVAVQTNNTIQIIRNERGERITPSFITFGEDEIFIGRDAEDQAKNYPTNAVYEFKRLIGQEFFDSAVQKDIKAFHYEVFNAESVPKIRVHYKGEDKEFFPQELSAFILKEMKRIAETSLGQTINRAVVTIPAYFNDSQRQATIDAGKIAGFQTVNIINEPTAAALAFDHQNPKDYVRNVLVYDFGGGTFDVSIVTVGRGLCKVKATDGDVHLGGTDIDSELVNYIKKDFEPPIPDDDILALRRLKSKCEVAKKELSHRTVYGFELSNIFNDEDIQKNISRAILENLTQKIIKRTIEIVEKCLKASKLNKDEIDEVLVVGGSSRAPIVKKTLQDFFGGKALNEQLNPDEAVAYGAAVYAASLTAEKDIIEDVTALSLGTDIKGNLMDVIIPRNTPIPVTKTKKYRTTQNDQANINVPVYQGERKIASENHKLGEFSLFGLPPGPAGTVMVTVSYALDKEGILNVSAYETGGKNKREIDIDMNKTGLSESQIEDKIHEFDQYHEDDKKKKEFVEKKLIFEKDCLDIKTEAEDSLSGEALNDILKECDRVLIWLQNLKLEDEGQLEVKAKELAKKYKDAKEASE